MSFVWNKLIWQKDWHKLRLASNPWNQCVVLCFDLSQNSLTYKKRYNKKIHMRKGSISRSLKCSEILLFKNDPGCIQRCVSGWALGKWEGGKWFGLISSPSSQLFSHLVAEFLLSLSSCWLEYNWTIVTLASLIYFPVLVSANGCMFLLRVETAWFYDAVAKFPAQPIISPLGQEAL